jgi:transcriptional regulator of met regulon
MASYTLIIDHDIRFDQWGWKEPYEKAVKASLEALGLKVLQIISKQSSSGRGLHYWIHIESPRQLSDEEINMLQFIAGDDRVRVQINQLRIARGVRKFWNKCFDHVIHTRPIDEKCKLCKLRKTILKMAKEEGLLAEGVQL